MLQSVDVGERSLDAYRGVAPDATIEELRRRAEDLRGARVLHINATPYGGGVSELLRSTVPLLNDLHSAADGRRRRRSARRWRRRVREHFLTPRLVLNELCLMSALAQGAATPLAERLESVGRDPVCGMAIADAHPPSAVHGERRYAFCSETCRIRFLDDPERFLALPRRAG